MSRRVMTAVVMVIALLTVVPSASADRDPYPHEFRHNMGYCAPYLAQLRLPDGSAVRPWINHLIHELTSSGAFEGQRNVGDLYSDRARDEQDRLCLARQ